MHELSIAQELVDLAAEQLELAGARRAAAVHVCVGARSGVVPAALRSAFAAAAAGTPLGGARLVIREAQPQVRCTECNAVREVTSSYRRRCEACGSSSVRLVGGDQLEFSAIEVESVGSAAAPS
jgi:hydrogenase nickel incorporation protein HypA/HybF